MCKYFLLLSLALVAIATLAHAKPKRTSSQGTKIVYASAPWNKDSRKIESAYLFIRDKNTGKVVKILLEETEPDSSIFSGAFSIQLDAHQELSPEVYIPPQNMRSEDALKNFSTLIRSGKMSRNPFVYKKPEKGTQSLDVYDTREQAQRALDIFNQQQKEQKELNEKNNPLTKTLADGSAIAAEELAQKVNALRELDKLAATRSEERLRMEQIEQQRLLEQKKLEGQLAEAEKNRRRNEAQQYAKKANALYQAGDFVNAEENFKKAVDLDPNNTNHYFKYGVSLYRNSKNDEALVILNLAKDEPETKVEKRYYMGLIHYKLKELEASKKYFSEVGSANDKVLSPSATFYLGVIALSEERYEIAKTYFEKVIDTSGDPKLDEKADEYIDNIAGLMAFKKNKAKKFILNATAGLTYDSNIIFQPTNTSAGASTNQAGAKALATGTAEYRFQYEKHREFSAKLNSVYMYAFDSQFAYTDPFLTNLSLPYTWKGVWATKGYKLTVRPAYEVLFMAQQGESEKRNILNGILLNTDLTLIMSDKLFSSYSLEVRQDDSQVASSVGDSNTDAMKYSAKTTQTLFIDKSKKRGIIASAGVVLNKATGKFEAYNRYDISLTYLAPLTWKDSSWLAGLAYYYHDQPDKDVDTTQAGTQPRIDNNVALNLGANKSISEMWSVGLIGNYTVNSSTSTTNDYNKYSVMTTATFNWGL